MNSGQFRGVFGEPRLSNSTTWKALFQSESYWLKHLSWKLDVYSKGSRTETCEDLYIVEARRRAEEASRFSSSVRNVCGFNSIRRNGSNRWNRGFNLRRRYGSNWWHWDDDTYEDENDTYEDENEDSQPNFYDFHDHMW